MSGTKCPKCGSDFVFVTLIGFSPGMRDPNTYHCHKCEEKWAVEPKVVQSQARETPPTETPTP